MRCDSSERRTAVRFYMTYSFAFRRLQFRSETSYPGNNASGGAGLEEKPWSLERVVEMTASYMERSI